MDRCWRIISFALGLLGAGAGAVYSFGPAKLRSSGAFSIAEQIGSVVGWGYVFGTLGTAILAGHLLRVLTLTRWVHLAASGVYSCWTVAIAATYFTGGMDAGAAPLFTLLATVCHVCAGVSIHHAPRVRADLLPGRTRLPVPGEV